LFIYPNIAYVMGSLVLVFGGLLTFTLIQNNTVNISRSADNFPQSETGSAAANKSVRSGPSDEDSQNFDRSFATNSANSNSNSAASTRPQKPLIAAGPQKNEPSISAAKPNENSFVMDGQSGGGGGGVAQAAPKAKREAELNAEEDRSAADIRTMSAPVPASPPAKIQSETKKARPYTETVKTINGQRFIQKEGVWYDIRYSGQPTINVRRGTSEYKKLDLGLKEIAETLNATSVILWKEKAYRISAEN
jgi:hypothetical protein